MWREPELKQVLALPRPDACGRQGFSYMCREPEPVCGFIQMWRESELNKAGLSLALPRPHECGREAGKKATKKKQKGTPCTGAPPAQKKKI